MIQGSHLPIPPLAAVAELAAAVETVEAADDAAAVPAPTAPAAAAAPLPNRPPSRDFPLPINATASAGKVAGSIPLGERRETNAGSNAPTADVTASLGRCSLSLNVDSKPPDAPKTLLTSSLVGVRDSSVVLSQLSANPPRPAERKRSSKPDRPPLAGSVM